MKRFLSFVLLGFMSLAMFGTNPVKKELGKEGAQITSAVTSLEVKEVYHLDNAEYKSAVVTNSGFPDGTSMYMAVGALLLFILYALYDIVSRVRKRDLIIGSLFLFAVTVSFFAPISTSILAVFPAVAFMRDDKSESGGGLTEDQLKTLMADISKKNGDAITAAVTKAIGEATKGFLTSEGFKAALKEAGIEKEQITKLEDALKAQGVAMKSFENISMNISKGGANTWKEDARKAIESEDMRKQLELVAKNKSGMVELYSSADKVVGNVTTASVSTNTGGNAILDTLNADEIAGLNLQSPFVEQFATVSRTSKPVFVYTDYKPKDGDAGFVAEGGAKPPIDLQVVTKYATPKKAAGHEILSTEVIQDVPRMQSEATTLLFKKYLLKRQNGILFGDGTGDTPIGVTTLARAFVPATWAGDKVQDPNLFDAVIAAATDILTTHNYTDEQEYYPNVAFVNPAILSALKLKKNEFGMYLFPQFVINGGKGEMMVDNLRLVGKREIPAAKILIGDFTKLRIINYIDYAVSMGWINAQFTSNLFTMVGEGRFFTLIKDLDKTAFIYDDIANITDGIASA